MIVARFLGDPIAYVITDRDVANIADAHKRARSGHDPWASATAGPYGEGVLVNLSLAYRLEERWRGAAGAPQPDPF